MSEQICILCQNEILNEFIMRCGHNFHKNCIKFWIKESSKCPKCSQPISKSKAFESLLLLGDKARVLDKLSVISTITNAEFTIEIIKISSNEVINRLKLCGLDFENIYSSEKNILRYVFYKGTAMILVRAVNDGVSEADTEVYDEDDNFLISASKIGNSELVKIFLEQNYYVNDFDYNLMTPLHWACKLQYVDVVRLLLDWDANIEVIDDFGYRPIYFACKTRNLELVKVLIEAGADLNTMDRDWLAPIHWATFLSNFELAALLINSGADVNRMDEYKNTALHSVTDERIARILIESGAKVNAVDENGCTPLHYARNAIITRILIESGANVNVLDLNSISKLHMICRRDYLKYCNIIEGDLSNFLKIDEQVVLDDQTAVEMAKILIESGADVNISDCKKNKPLHFACQSEFFPMVQLLVDSGADVGVVNNNGFTPLSIAIETNNSEITQILKEAGAVIIT